MKKKHRIDRPFLIITTILISLGAIMMFSSSPTIAFSNYNDSYFFIKRHIMFLCLGSLAMLLGSIIPNRWYQKITIPGFLLACMLLGITLIPGIGVSVGGASRWLDLGFFSIQPVEIAKFFIITYLSLYLMNKKDKIKTFSKGFFPVLCIVSIPIVILANQPDLGNILVLVSTLGVMLFLSRASIIQLLSLGTVGISMIVLNILSNTYQKDRIRTFFDPWSDPLGRSYHIIQSFIAIGSGGILGHGLGQSKLKYFYLPLHYSDFIFSIICEEGGFILGAFVVVLFIMLALRGIHIATHATTMFSTFLAIGLTTLLVVQAALNIGAVIGVFPVTGIPLTFISYGGTSLVMSMFYAGVIMNISKNG